MSITAMNEYRITQENGDSVIAVALTASAALAAFDSDISPVTQLVRIRVGLQVETPDGPGNVNFRTVVAGSGAISAGCVATPGSFEVVDGTTVIFEAIPAIGYNFIGWFKGTNTTGTPESTTTTASIAIEATVGVSADIIITALFAPIA